MKFLYALCATLLTACGLLQPSDACERTDADTAAWTAAQQSRSDDAYRTYLAEFPNGCFARRAIAELRKESDSVSLSAVNAASVSNGGGNAY